MILCDFFSLFKIKLQMIFTQPKADFLFYVPTRNRSLLFYICCSKREKTHKLICFLHTIVKTMLVSVARILARFNKLTVWSFTAFQTLTKCFAPFFFSFFFKDDAKIQLLATWSSGIKEKLISWSKKEI